MHGGRTFYPRAALRTGAPGMGLEGGNMVRPRLDDDGVGDFIQQRLVESGLHFLSCAYRDILWRKKAILKAISLEQEPCGPVFKQWTYRIQKGNKYWKKLEGVSCPSGQSFASGGGQPCSRCSAACPRAGPPGRKILTFPGGVSGWTSDRQNFRSLCWITRVLPARSLMRGMRLASLSLNEPSGRTVEVHCPSKHFH